MSISYWLDKSNLKPTKNYDFIIIGGGIAGLSSAYWLQKQSPSAKIALLEKNQLGSGASGRNAGFVTCGSIEHFIKLQEKFGLEKALEIWKFSETNRHLLSEHIIEDQADSVDFKSTGSCTVAPSESHFAKYQQTIAVMKANGIDIEAVDSSFMESDYGVTGFQGGAQYNGDGYIHPLKLLQRIRSKLTIDIFEHTEVFEFQDQGSQQVLKTDQGTFAASQVLVTVNAYLPLVMPSFSNIVTPQRGQILVTEPLPQFVRGPCYLTKDLCYFRQLPTGHLLIGGFRNLSLETENTLLDQTTPIIQEALLTFVKERFKFGKEAQVANTWAGLMGFTPDGQMIIGATPGNKNIHVMAGCSGHGMGLSFHAARVLVESLNEKAIPTHLNLNRFVSTLKG